jgi:hypothetical protein
MLGRAALNIVDLVGEAEILAFHGCFACATFDRFASHDVSPIRVE